MHVIRWQFVTTREFPADAATRHERLLYRAGFLRKAQAGVYLWLPLGALTLRRMVQLLEEGCASTGFLPIVAPHCKTEQALVESVRPLVRSWRALPVRWYLLQQVIADEIEPRGGLLQTRESLGLQLWSFDADPAAAAASGEQMRDLLLRLCRQMGMEVVAAQGNGWHLMTALAEGEERFAQCLSCGAAALPEYTSILPPAEPSADAAGVPPAQVVSTPGQHTVEEISQFLQVPPSQVVKTLLLEADGQAVAALVRGDHELSLPKVAQTLNAQRVHMMGAEQVESVSGAPPGFAGPVGLEGVPLIADWAVRQVQGFVVGANRGDAHRIHVCWGRDFPEPLWADLRVATEGDRCVHCGGSLALRQAVCVGKVHPWQGEQTLVYDTAQGAQQPVQVTVAEMNLLRALAALVERSSDQDGLVWHARIAPFQAVVLALNPADPVQHDAAKQIYQHLRDYGIDALLDDRDERAGVKFKDADLIGIPVQVVVGRTAAEGKVEVRLRRDRQPRQVAVEDAAIVVRELIHRELEGVHA